MKKVSLAFPILIALLWGIGAGCGKRSVTPVSNTLFYLAEDCGNGQTTVSINGTSKQISQIFSTAPKCGEKNTASFQLAAGTYAYTVTDNSGNRSGSITVEANKCNTVRITCDSFSTNIRNIISQEYIDSLRKWGVIIHPGQTPPGNLNGIYRFAPTTCSHRWSAADHYYIGQVIDDYKYRFANQTADAITVSKKNYSETDTASGIAGYISGSGNAFTIFGKISGVSNSTPYTEVMIVSGTMTPSGIADMQYGFIVTAKTGDLSNTAIIPVGTGRVFYDGDELSEYLTSFRPAAGASIGYTVANMAGTGN